LISDNLLPPALHRIPTPNVSRSCALGFSYSQSFLLLLVVLWLLFLSGSERRRPDQTAKDRSSVFSWKLAMCRGSGTRCFVNLVEEEEEVGIQCNFLSSKNFHLKKQKGAFYHKFSDC